MEAEENPSTAATENPTGAAEVAIEQAATAFETFHQDEPKFVKKVKLPIMSKVLMRIGAWNQPRYFSPKWGRTDQTWNGTKGHFYYHDIQPGSRSAKNAVVAWDPISKHVIAWAPMRLLADGVADVR